MFSNWMLQSKEFNPENSNTSATTFKQRASKQKLLGEITENLAQLSPRGNIHKLSDCIKTPLKYFLPCLAFHMPLHKRMLWNTQSSAMKFVKLPYLVGSIDKTNVYFHMTCLSPKYWKLLPLSHYTFIDHAVKHKKKLYIDN